MICLKYKCISDKRHCCTDAWSTKMSGGWRRSEKPGTFIRNPSFHPRHSACRLLSNCLFFESQMRPICSQINPSVLCTLVCGTENFRQKGEQDRLSGLIGSMAPGSEATGISVVLTVTDHRRSRGKEIFNYIGVIWNLQNVSICVHVPVHMCMRNTGTSQMVSSLMEPMQQTEFTRHSEVSKAPSTHLVSYNPLTWIREVHKSPSQWTF